MQTVWYLPEVQFTSFGFRHIHAQTSPVTLWIDDIAVDERAIGCPSTPNQRP